MLKNLPTNLGLLYSYNDVPAVIGLRKKVNTKTDFSINNVKVVCLHLD
jgi:hypothetical protein